mmetsp:Transcript_31376/g.89014  ORF Transcript_31376/g.89014 Transcript_31376/m.89014 type:complete len:545 (+) Transcript_31376:1106-2740(+)
MHPAGAVSVRTSSALLAPVPADINQNRAAHAVVRLVLLGDQDFASSRVLLRLRDNYHTFMYAHTGASQSGRSWSGFLCSLPLDTQPGLGWVKVVGSDRSIEPAFPLLLTHDAELCVELNKLLPQHYQTIEQSCNFLVGLSNALFSSTSLSSLPSPHVHSLLLETVGLCADRSFRLLMERARDVSAQYPQQLLDAVDRSTPEGLISAAVLSGSVEMTNTVIVFMAMNGLSVDPCRLAFAGHGFSALHWAALQGSQDLVCTLLYEVDNPAGKWETLRARNCGFTPQQLMGAVDRSFCLELLFDGQSSMSTDDFPSQDVSANEASDLPEADNNHGEEGDADAAKFLAAQEELWGHALFSALACSSSRNQLGFLGLYALLVWALGSHDPLSWVTLCLLIPTLHLLVPYAYRHYYTPRLAEARHVLNKAGLSLSSGLVILEPSARRAFDSYAMKRTTLGLAMDSALMVMFLGVFSLSPVHGAYKQGGTVSLWMTAPFLIGVAVLVPTRIWATMMAWRQARQWITVAPLSTTSPRWRCSGGQQWALPPWG